MQFLLQKWAKLALQKKLMLFWMDGWMIQNGWMMHEWMYGWMVELMAMATYIVVATCLHCS